MEDSPEQDIKDARKRFIIILTSILIAAGGWWGGNLDARQRDLELSVKGIETQQDNVINTVREMKQTLEKVLLRDYGLSLANTETS